VSYFTLADGSASISGELSLLAEKEYTIPLSKKDTTESLKTALYELLLYADTVKGQNNSIVKLAKKHTEQYEDYDKRIKELEDALLEAVKDLKEYGSFRFRPVGEEIIGKYIVIAKGE